MSFNPWNKRPHNSKFYPNSRQNLACATVYTPNAQGYTHNVPVHDSNLFTKFSSNSYNERMRDQLEDKETVQFDSFDDFAMVKRLEAKQTTVQLSFSSVEPFIPQQKSTSNSGPANFNLEDTLIRTDPNIKGHNKQNTPKATVTAIATGKRFDINDKLYEEVRLKLGVLGEDLSTTALGLVAIKKDKKNKPIINKLKEHDVICMKNFEMLLQRNELMVARNRVSLTVPTFTPDTICTTVKKALVLGPSHEDARRGSKATKITLTDDSYILYIPECYNYL